MSRRVRLLHVTNDASAFTSHRLPLAKAAQEAGYDVHVAAPEHAALQRLAAMGFTVHAIPLGRRSLNPLKEQGTLRALTALFRKVKPDLVQTVTMKPNVYGGIAARRAKVPAVIATFAGLGYAFSSPRAKAKAIRAALMPMLRTALGGPTTWAIFENDGNRRQLVAAGVLPDERARLIKSIGVPLEEFPFLPAPDHEAPVVALASRMLWSKGVGEFVAAARRLRTEGVHARFALIGPLDLENPEGIPEAQLAAWRDSGDVEWWGRLPEVLDVFRRSDVLCLPSSYAEGVPRVLLEAAACGRPVIASDEAGCKEACQDGVSGFVVPVGDETALAKAIQRLVEDRALRIAMGAAGRRLVEAEFDQRLVVAKTLELYDEVLARTGAGGGRDGGAPFKPTPGSR